MSERLYYSVPEIAERFGVHRNKVLKWIAAGELSAMDTSVVATSQRPRWRVSADSLAAFELARTSQPKTRRPRRRRNEAAKGKSFIQ